MEKQISSRTFTIAIVVTAVGTCLLSLLGYYLFTIWRRRVKQRAHEEEKDGNAALDRAIVSYTGKEQSNPPGLSAPEGPQKSQPAMTTAIHANLGSAGVDNPAEPSPRSIHELPAPTAVQGQALEKTVTLETDTSRSLRRTASSHFLDSAERVYACILASPLERMRTWSTPSPAPRDDVGWPLAPKGGWL
ncbi:uncharacterized protein B0H64DRAFT_189809 [Chaetomium fimeti]|uniref:Uncharacterized protein n=1 Tax=Chaetomium fimeti TaxID=1854472 RepID=A0AAE0LR89_9PEZI|nr:hypothetical protein B0H64DRAFT_189809 [Chaetomium fimeti]